MDDPYSRNVLFLEVVAFIYLKKNLSYLVKEHFNPACYLQL